MIPKSFRSPNRKLSRALFILLLLSLLPGSACNSSDSLPTDWNRVNLAKIKVAATPKLTFAVLGDNRGNPAVLAGLLRQIDRDPDIAFAVHLGDMVGTATPEQYRVFFQAVQQNFHKPLLGVIGNHELKGQDGLQLFHKLFGPDNYAFQVNRNYFIAVDDNSKSVWGEEQWRWLEQELQKAQGYQSRLVLLHIPLFDPQPVPGHPAALPPAAAARFIELFKKYRVTYIFTAHKHGYFAGQWDGIPFTLTAGAGAPLYGQDPEHFFYHYVKVSITGGKVAVQVQKLKD
jgi:serine/threonine-protein phosphatase CPPED1